MKCNSCKVEINAKFKFAFKYNKCPACDKSIMPQHKVAAFMGLQELLMNNFPKSPADQIASLVIANFELKQLFKDGGAVDTEEDETVEVYEYEEEDDWDEEEEMDPNVLADQNHKDAQMESARRKIREQEYQKALLDQWGMGDTDLDGNTVTIFDEEFGEGAADPVNPREEALKLLGEVKNQERHQNMLSGRGGFSRST